MNDRCAFAIEFVRDESSHGVFDSEDETVSEAISSTYSYRDCLRVSFGSTVAILDLRGDLHELYDELVKLISSIVCGELMSKAWFLSSALTARWTVTVHDEHLDIDAAWTDVSVLGDGAQAKNNLPARFNVSTAEFLGEWSRVFSIIKDDLERLGFTKLRDYPQLLFLASMTSRYREPHPRG